MFSAHASSSTTSRTRRTNEDEGGDGSEGCCEGCCEGWSSIGAAGDGIDEERVEHGEYGVELVEDRTEGDVGYGAAGDDVEWYWAAAGEDDAERRAPSARERGVPRVPCMLEWVVCTVDSSEAGKNDLRNSTGESTTSSRVAA